MKISAIIPVYNRGQLVGRAIRSILDQTIKPFEIIVVNDGSTDDTLSVLREFENKIVLINQDNRGVAAARNKGIKCASGNWIAFLDSDDEWLPDKIEQAVEFHNQYPEYRIFQSEEIWMRNGTRVNPKRIHKKIGGHIFSRCLAACIVSPSAVVVQKTLLEEVGYFDEQFTVCEDYDLWLRISRKYEIGLNRFPGTIKYGGHADQLSTKFWGMDRFRVSALEKHAMDETLSVDYRIPLLNELKTKLQILITGYRNRGKEYTEFLKKYQYYEAELNKLKQSIK